MAAEYLDGQRLPGDINPGEWDGFHDIVVTDELARCGYLGIVWALGCGNSIGGPPVINFGSEEQKRRFLPDMLKGNIRFCLGVTEPDGEIFCSRSNAHGNDLLTTYSYSWLRCCCHHHYCREEGRCLHCQWSKEMDHEWYLRRLLHCSREDWGRRHSWYFGIGNPDEGAWSDLQENREFRCSCKWLVVSYVDSMHELAY